jgi:hypothetical protein
MNFRDDQYFGQNSGWYQNLTQLIADWGIEA